LRSTLSGRDRLAASTRTRTAQDYRSADLRVLFVTARFRPDIGGVEHHVDEVAPRLAHRHGCEVTVLTTGLERGLPASETADGVAIRRVRAWPKGRDLYVAPGLFSILATELWDIVHVQSYHTFVAPIAMLAAARRRLPYVLTFHGGGHSSHLRNNLRGAQLRALRPLLKRADRLIANARWEIDHYSGLLRLGKARFVLIPNGSDFSVVPAVAADGRSGFLVVSVGRLERYKGHQRVIAALPYLIREEPDARLWIAGAGQYEPELRALSEALGVADRVQIQAVPIEARERMATRLSEAAAFVLMSERETHPVAALEAISLGRPAVVADTPGLQDLADDGLARAIPLNSPPAAVAAAILEEARKPNRSPLPRLPSWDDCAAGLFELYEAVLRERRASTA
jgi:glycosyltransferase involved in cell wall biosynthesis